MSKKISEWLAELPMPHRELAIANYENAKMHDPSYDSMHMALLSAFDWAESNEGFAYWSDVFDVIDVSYFSNTAKPKSDIEDQLAKTTKERDEWKERYERLNEPLAKNKRLFSSALAERVIDEQAQRIRQLESLYSEMQKQYHELKSKCTQ